MVGLKHTKVAQNAKTDEFIDDVDDSSDSDGNRDFKVLSEVKEKTVYKGSKHNIYKEKEREKRKMKEQRHREKIAASMSDESGSSHKEKHKTHKEKHIDEHKYDKMYKEKREKRKRREKFKKQQNKAKPTEKTDDKEDESAPRPKIKPRFNKPMPPPMSFEQLMSLASDGKGAMNTMLGGGKLHNKGTAPKKKKELRPMTADEKESYEWRQSKEYQQWLKVGGERPRRKKYESESESENDDVKSPISIMNNGERKSVKNGYSNSNGDTTKNGKMKEFSDVPNSVKDNMTQRVANPVPKGGYLVNPRSLEDIQKHKTDAPRLDGSRPDGNDNSHNNVLVCKSKKNTEPEMSPWDRIYGQQNKPKGTDGILL